MKAMIPWFIVVALVVALLTYLLTTMFRPVAVPDRDLQRENTALRDSLISISNRSAESRVAELNAVIDQKNEQIKELSERKQQIIIREKQIPVIVGAYTDPELSSAAEEWADR